MKLKRFRAESYRALEKFDFIFPDSGCICIVDDNEKGKSSMLLGILACLYGTPKELSLYKHSNLELEFTLKGHLYRVVIQDGKKRLFEDERDITSRVYKKVGRAYRYLIGENLFGLNAEEFVNTVLVKQHELVSLAIAEHAPTLVPKIQSMVEFTEDGHTSQRAILLLEKGLEKNYPRVTLKQRTRGDAEKELKALQRQLDVLQKEKQDLYKEITIHEELIERYEEIIRKIKDTERDIQLTELKKLLAELKGFDELNKKIDNLKTRLSSLRPYPEIDADEIPTIEAKIKAKYNLYTDTLKEIEFRKNELSTVEQNIQSIEQAIKNYPDVIDKDMDQALRLQELAAELKSINDLIEETKYNLNEKVNSFGFSLEKFERLNKTVESLSTQDLGLLQDYPEQQPRLKERIQKLEETLKLRKQRLLSLVMTITILLIALALSFKDRGFLLIALACIPFIYNLYRINKRLRVEPIKSSTKNELEDLKRRVILNEEGIRRIREIHGIDTADYAEYLRWLHDFKTIEEYEKRLLELEGKKEQILLEIKKIQPFKEPPGPDELSLLITRIKKYNELKAELDFQKRKLSDLKEAVENLTQKADTTIKGLCDFINGVLQVSVKEREIEEILKDAEDKLKKARQASDIKALLSELSPPEDEQIHHIKERIDVLKKRLGIDELPEVQHDVEYYERSLEEKNHLLRSLYHNKDEFEQKRRRIINIRDKIIELDQEIKRISYLKEQAHEYVEAIKKAIFELKRISLSNYIKWAERLNRDSSRILKSITGKDRSVVFGKDLNFRIVSDNEDLTDEQLEDYLSGGTLEQLYLAIRIAISEYLTPEIRLPLILDEPFAHADDARFLKALKFLTNEIAKKRQVIILSCHRKRHMDIKNQMGEGFILFDGIFSNLTLKHTEQPESHQLTRSQKLL